MKEQYNIRSCQNRFRLKDTYSENKLSSIEL